ncbi:MAG: hypothetical protein FJX70_07235 [Alphaproteobacteria bacterium]|nr:hypothetical protein [Alphaproteobacteria bacterium]
MKYDRLYNFISPVTGKLPIDRGYILLGDKEGRSFASPVLIDVRQDIIDLKRKIGNFEELKKLDHNRIWIGDYYNEPVEQLHIGIINLPPLAEAVFPNPISPIIGDFRIPNPTFDYLSPFDWVMSGPFLPQIYATKYDTFGNPIGTDISSSLAMTQVRAAQIMKRFDNANFIVGSSTVTFAWENPKMYLIPEALKQLYGLGTTYTFTKAQSLGNLQTGLLKNTVNNATGTLSTAIAGKDYVEVAAPIANMQLTLIRPELIQEGQDVAKLLSRVARLPADNMPNLTTGKYWKGGANNIPIEVDIPTYAPTDATYVLNTPNNNLPNSQALNTIGSGILKIATFANGIISIASGGKVPVVNDYVRPIDLEEETGERIASDTAIEGAIAALEAEVEAEIAALAGVQAISILGTILGFIGVAVGGKAYGDYIRGQLLNVKNKWTSADLNDEGHNAVGDYEFRFPSGYSSDDRGFSTLWFDSHGRSDGHKSEGGLRLFSWDSGGDHIGSDSPIAPLHIGLFGYQNKYHIWPFPNPTAKYKGFIFSIPDFHNESSSDDYYRFPKRFGLYDVTRTIGTWTSNKYGWDSKETIFEYDYNNFNFYKKVVLKEYTNFEKEADFQKNVKFLGTGAVKIPVGNITERPSNSEVGMLRYNIEI